MARVTQDLTAAGETIEIDIPEDEAGYGAIQYGDDGGAGTWGSIKAEGTNDGISWHSLSMMQSVDDAPLSGITTPNLCWFRVFGYTKIRARKYVAGTHAVKTTLSYSKI